MMWRIRSTAGVSCFQVKWKADGIVLVAGVAEPQVVGGDGADFGDQEEGARWWRRVAI